MIRLLIDNPEKFDRLVHGTPDTPSLPDTGEIEIVTKAGQTEDGRSIVVISWLTKYPDPEAPKGSGCLARVQTVLTVSGLLMAMHGLKAVVEFEDEAAKINKGLN